MVFTYILYGTIGTVLDDGPGLDVDFRDEEGTVNNGSELVSRFLVTFHVYMDVDLITGIDFLVFLPKTFVNLGLYRSCAALSLSGACVIAFMNHCFHFCLNYIGL